MCDPKIRRSSWVGISLPVFQQLTGIDVAILYSSTIFKNAGTFSANQGSAIVNTANMVSTIIGVLLLGIAGRKKIMLINQFFIVITLSAMFYADTTGNDTLELYMIVAFVCFFEFGPGPIAWVYLSEVSNDEATSIGTMMSWSCTLIIGLTAPYMLDNWLKSYTWLLFAAISLMVSTSPFVTSNK